MMKVVTGNTMQVDDLRSHLGRFSRLFGLAIRQRGRKGEWTAIKV